MIDEFEHEIAEIMKTLHKKYLNQKFISWGDFMRAGIKCSRLTSNTIPDCSCQSEYGYKCEECRKDS